MGLTTDDVKNYRKAKNCNICGEAFTESNKKVRDHCHRTGNSWGAAHNACNLRGYDNHLSIKKAFDIVKDKEIIWLRNLCRRETGHGQWDKQALNIAALVLSVLCQVLRGGNGYGFNKCSIADWTTFSLYLVFMTGLITLAVGIIRREQALKKKYGNINIVDSDVVF